MNFSHYAATKFNRKSGRFANEFAHQYLQHNLQFYTEIPNEKISLIDLGILAVERQKALRAVESAGQMYAKYSTEYESYLEAELNKGSLKILRKSMRDVENDNIDEVLESRRKDNLSHFILMLAYCDNKETKDWFITQETDLFKFRYGLELGADLNKFFELNNLNIERVASDEKEDLLDALATSTAALSKSVSSKLRLNFDESASFREKRDVVLNADFFKAPFQDVMNLVKTRRVLVSRGYAYVPRHELISIVAGKFRNKLSRMFAVLTKQQTGCADQRLGQIFRLIRQKGCSLSTYSSIEENSSVITASMIDTLAKISFPPCMRNLYTHLHNDHHLRHGGRMQFGLFLKGIGIPLEEALKFWKAEFAPKVDSEKFDKNYAYSIRHTYGKEGKRVSHSPYGCLKIITQNVPSSMDFHGCPFRHMETAVLRQNLKNWGIKSNEEQSAILKLSESKQYDRACSRFFEFSHQLPENSLPQLISHPNYYFDESRKRLNQSAKPNNIDRNSQIPIQVDIMD